RFKVALESAGDDETTREELVVRNWGRTEALDLGSNDFDDLSGRLVFRLAGGAENARLAPGGELAAATVAQAALDAYLSIQAAGVAASENGVGNLADCVRG